MVFIGVMLCYIVLHLQGYSSVYITKHLLGNGWHLKAVFLCESKDKIFFKVGVFQMECKHLLGQLYKLQEDHLSLFVHMQ